MKNTLLFLFASFTLLQVNAQVWTVGIPVNRTIIDYPANIIVTRYCDSINFPNGMDKEIRLPLPQVSGINYYVVIDYATNPTHTYKLRQPGGNTQIMSLGDSMQVFPIGAVDTIRVSYAGYDLSEVSIKFKAIGTPLTAGEHYPCGSTDDGWFNQPIGCWDPTLPNSTTYLTSCVVQTTLSIDDLKGFGSALIFPNPAKAILNIQVSNTDFSKNTNLIFINTLGQKIKHVSINAELTTINIDNMTAGMYFYQFQNNNGILKKGKLIIE